MKSKGVVRNLDPVGRIVIPMEIRKNLGLQEGDDVEILVNGNSIILKKHVPNCIICGNSKELQEINGKLVCKKCVAKLKG